MRETSSVTVAGLRIGVPAAASTSPQRSATFTPKPAPLRSRWETCPACGGNDRPCATCGGSGAVLIPQEQPEQAAPPQKAPRAAAKKAPAKKTAARKAGDKVTAKKVETLERGQRVRWSKADLLDPAEADDEDRWWPVPEGVWRQVCSVTEETTDSGEQVVIIEYASSRHTGGDFDERTYQPGTFLPTQPPTFRTHTIGGTLKVGDHLRIGCEEWIIHADGLEDL